MTERFLGIDPGDRWVGGASLHVVYAGHSIKSMMAHMWILDRTVRPFHRAVLDTLEWDQDPSQPGFGDNRIIVEQYQHRAVGHQRFSALETVQMIGGLRYVTGQRERYNSESWAWHTVPPGNPDKEVPKLPFYEFLKEWQTHWPMSSAPVWRHALAAWRVLGRHLLARRQDVLVEFTRHPLKHNFQLVPNKRRLNRKREGDMAPIDYARWSVD